LTLPKGSRLLSTAGSCSGASDVTDASASSENPPGTKPGGFLSPRDERIRVRKAMQPRSVSILADMGRRSGPAPTRGRLFEFDLDGSTLQNPSSFVSLLFVVLDVPVCSRTDFIAIEALAIFLRAVDGGSNKRLYERGEEVG